MQLIQHTTVVALHRLPYNNISQEEGDVNKNSNNFIEPKNTLCR